MTPGATVTCSVTGQSCALLLIDCVVLVSHSHVVRTKPRPLPRPVVAASPGRTGSRSLWVLRSGGYRGQCLLSPSMSMLGHRWQEGLSSTLVAWVKRQACLWDRRAFTVRQSCSSDIEMEGGKVALAPLLSMSLVDMRSRVTTLDPHSLALPVILYVKS